jgi:hypothetical protein
MLGAGVHPKIVSERLGPPTIAIAIDTYQHMSPPMQREAAAAMGAILSRALRKSRARRAKSDCTGRGKAGK